MKKVIVLTLAAGVIFVLFLATVGLRAPGRRMTVAAPSTYKHGMDKEDDRMRDEPAPPEASAPVVMKAELSRRAANKGLLKIVGATGAAQGDMGLFGAGEGGGGVGDAIGIGGLGTRGAGGGKDKKKPAGPKGGEASGGEGEGEGGAPTRAWFPETFLFEPLVVTDAQGRANVPVKVPDRLTTWRVLALAHSREGGQAGGVTSFLGTLPTYVEPVTPPLLYAGDEVRLPVQVVNTTTADISSPLHFEAMGATLAAVGGTVRVPAEGSVVQYVTLTAKRPGTATVKATLGDTDAVARTIDISPAGKREVINHGGSLAAPRTFELEGPANALPGSEATRLQVFPGALGFMRNELAAAPGRGGVAEDAYLLQLLGSAPAVLRSLGAEPATDVIRDLSILATQRVMRHARAPSVDAATLLTEAALAHPDNPVLSRLGERLSIQVAKGQRPDGTCEGGNGWTLQRLLVTTADCVRAVRSSSSASPQAKQRATAVTIKASGAFERNVARVNDGYTAAAILASGAVSGEVAEKLKTLMLGAIESGPDGAKYLKVDKGVVRPDGSMPSTYEATALAVIALQGDAKAPLADLGTHLLAGYSPFYGWGDGRTNLVALRAVILLFKDPLPSSVKIVLERDGKVMAEGTLGADKLKEVIRMEADASGSSGKHTWSVRAEPPVAGLGYTLALVAYTPWKDEPGGGLELTTALPDRLQVGQPGELALTAAMPSGMPTSLRVALPAGVQADTTSLDALVSSGQVIRYETEDGAVTLHVPAQTAGATWQSKLKVIPTLAGKLQSGPSSLTPETNVRLAKFFAPKTWTVK